MKLRSKRICSNMEHNPISFRDVADEIFKLFTVGETLMSSHENADRVKRFMTEINIAYDTFNSLCPQLDSLDLPGNVSSKIEFDTKYWVFKHTVQQWFDIVTSKDLKVSNTWGTMSQSGDDPSSIPSFVPSTSKHLLNKLDKNFNKCHNSVTAASENQNLSRAPAGISDNSRFTTKSSSSSSSSQLIRAKVKLDHFAFGPKAKRRKIKRKR